MTPPNAPPPTTKPSTSTTSLFQVYLRLRPPPSPLVQPTHQSLYPLLHPSCPERYLTVEKAQDDATTPAPTPTHITIHPPSDSRKRAVEKFAFTRVFEEGSEQGDIFRGIGLGALIEGVVFGGGGEGGGGGGGRDGLLATLGVTGSGKVGSKS